MRILIVAALIGSASLACNGSTPRSDGGSPGPTGDGRLPAPTKKDAGTIPLPDAGSGSGSNLPDAAPPPDGGLQTPDALL